MSDEATEAAEMVAGVESPAAPTNAEIAADPLFDKLAADLGAMTGADEPEKKEEPAEAKKDEAEEDDAEPEFDDLSDDKPWTPERIKNAAAQLRNDKRKVGSLLARLDKREGKLRARVDTFKREKAQSDLFAQTILNDVKMAREGTPEQSIAALGRLAQRDPYKFYEDLSLSMMGKGPQSQKDAATRALEEKIEALTRKLEAKDQESEAEKLARRNHEAQAEARQRAVEILQSADEWPLLAERAAAAPQQTGNEFWTIYIQESRRAGRYLDVDTVADRIERKLRLQSMPSSRAKQNGTTGSGPGREQETRAQANPETAQSTPRSLSPSQSATSGAAR
jgi:hypothetical protein